MAADQQSQMPIFGSTARITAAKTGLYLINASDLGELKAPRWLVKKHLVADSMAMLYGPSGGGKSFCAIDMGLSVATGRDWHGAPVEQGGVLYVAGEGGRGLNARIVAWCRHHGIDDSVPLPFEITSQPVPLLDRQRVNELMKVMAEMAEVPKLIIVDTLNRNFGDGDENTTKDMTHFVDALGHLQMVTGACVLVVHHTGKGDSELARGNSSLRAAMDTEMALRTVKGGLKLACTKQKDAGEFAPKGFELKVLELGTDEDGEEITSCVLVKSQASTLAGGFVDAQKPTSVDEKALFELVPNEGEARSNLLHRFIEARKQRKEGKPDSHRRAFLRSLEKLIKAGKLQSSEDDSGQQRICRVGI